MIRPGVVPDSMIHKLVRIAGSLGSKLPYSPVATVFRIEESDETVERVSIGALRVCLRGAGTSLAR
jgi:hypothetical protein